MDVDVVDTSWLDGAGLERHNCFYTNTWLIDDLREVLVMPRRAAARRLLHQAGNVWSLLAAPREPGALDGTRWRDELPLTSTRAATDASAPLWLPQELPPTAQWV